MLTHSFEQTSEHVYWLAPNPATDRPTLGVVTGSRGTLIVDAGNSPAHARHVLDEMKHRGIPAPTFVMLTHWHWDHVFGASEFHAPILANTGTARAVNEMASWDWSDAALDERVARGIELPFCRDNIVKELPDRGELVLRPPDLAFSGDAEVELGGVTAELLHVGGDHAADSTVVYVPRDKIVFLGDCLYPDIYHSPNRYTRGKLYPLIERLLALDADIYFEGHNPKPTTRVELIEFTTLLRAIGDAVESPAQDRAATFAELKKRADLKLLDEDIEYVDAFAEGLKSAGA